MTYVKHASRGLGHISSMGVAAAIKISYLKTMCEGIQVFHFIIILFIYLFFFFFLGLHSRHMVVPGLGLNQSYSCGPTPQPKQCGI